MPYRKEVISDDSPLNIEPSNRDDSSEMEEAEPATQNVPYQLVEAGELLIKLTTAYQQGKLNQFMVDTNVVNGTAIATFWVKTDVLDVTKQ